MSEEYEDWQSGQLKVVKNHEGYCSIWPLYKTTPIGWEEVGKTGNKEECLQFIRENCDRNARFKG